MRDGAKSEKEHDEQSLPVLDSRIRAALHAARGNEKIRDRLVEIVRDHGRFDSIVKALGPSHAHVLDLLAIARHVKAVRRDWGRVQHS